MKKRRLMKINVAFNRDCMDAMKEFPDGFFDLAVVDPPYGGGCSQIGNVERERERELQPIRSTVRPLQTVNRTGFHGKNPYHLGGGGLTSQVADGRDRVSRTGGTWAEKFGKKSSRGTLPRNRNTLTSCFASLATR